MNFVYPQFLWGLLALSVPIIIHLFNFRRTRKVYFSNNYFLKNVKEATTSKLKIKHLLILLARLLFVTFLVITFAQPFLPGEENADSSNNTEKLVYIYLDNSLSMSSELSSNIRGIDLGVNYIEEILSLYPRNTQYKFLTNEFGSFSRVPKSSDELGELIAGVDLTGVSRSASEVLGKIQSDIAADAFGSASSRESDIYVISDFQRSTFGDPEVFAEDTVNTVKLVPITTSYESNVYIDSVYLANPFVLAEEANELAVILRNDGEQDISDQIVRLLINEEQVASASLDVSSNASGMVRFTLNFPLQQNNRCQLVFEDYPVTFDNQFYFNLNLSDKISVLEIRPGLQNLGPDQRSGISQVYANEDIFDFQSFSLDNLDYSLVESSDMVVLNELGGTSDEANRAVIPYLRNYLADGGHVLYIPPATADLSFLQQVTGNPGISGERISVPDSVEGSAMPLFNPDLANPFFEGMFEGKSENFAMPAARQMMRHNIQGQPLLRYRNGEPYLMVMSDRYITSELPASDQFYFFVTPLRDEFTNLHRHAVFVPVMYRLASLSKSMNNELYYYIDNPTIALEISSFEENELEETADAPSRRFIYKLRQGEEEVIPTQRLVSGRLLMEIPQDVVKSGFYDLLRTEENGVADNEAVRVMTLSFNIDEKESMVEQYTLDDLQTIFASAENVAIYEAEDVEEFISLISNEQTSIALWKYTLLLALFFLLTEVLLIRFL